MRLRFSLPSGPPLERLQPLPLLRFILDASAVRFRPDDACGLDHLLAHPVDPDERRDGVAAEGFVRAKEAVDDHVLRDRTELAAGVSHHLYELGAVQAGVDLDPDTRPWAVYIVDNRPVFALEDIGLVDSDPMVGIGRGRAGRSATGGAEKGEQQLHILHQSFLKHRS